MTEAEISWTILTVLTHSSLHSCDGLSKLFAGMFGDSMIAELRTFARTKWSYFLNFGIAPNLKDLLLTKLKLCSVFVACYQHF